MISIPTAMSKRVNFVVPWRLFSSRHNTPNESNYETIFPPAADTDAPYTPTDPLAYPSSSSSTTASTASSSTPTTTPSYPTPHHSLHFTALPKRVRCFNCGQMGHISYDCTQPQVRKACYVCGNPGHLSRDCPKNVKALYCTACGQTGHLQSSCPRAGVE